MHVIYEGLRCILLMMLFSRFDCVGHVFTCVSNKII